MRTWFLLLPCCLLVAACSSSSNDASLSAGGGGDPGTGTPVGGGDFSGSGGSASAGNGSDAGVPSGVLTAGAWDDNRNYGYFTGFLVQSTPPGAPPLTMAERDAAHALFAGARPAKQRLDVTIVIDTTGSMGDEAAYLKAELGAISASITAEFPGADQRWGLVAYRDRPDTDPNDGYVTQTTDLTGDVGAFQGAVGGLTTGNGGDYPEAPELGLAAMNALSWRADADVARLAFWVGDAPQHATRASDIAQAFEGARQRDIHIYPVAASGADPLLELTMRDAAQLTGGRYLFLTDDSGIGNAHEVPSIPCYFVTKLARQIVRMVSIELSGQYREPDPADILRTGGDPQSGACTLPGDAGTVSVF